MKAKDVTQSVRISREAVKTVKRYIIEEGGTIRSILEEGILLRISKAKKQNNGNKF